MEDNTASMSRDFRNIFCEMQTAYEQFPEQSKILTTGQTPGCGHYAAHWMHIRRRSSRRGKQRKQGHKVLSEQQTERQARRRALPPDPRVERGASYEKEDRISRPSDEPGERLQTERRLRRVEKSEIRPIFSPRAGRTSSRRASKAVEYD